MRFEDSIISTFQWSFSVSPLSRVTQDDVCHVKRSSNPHVAGSSRNDGSGWFWTCNPTHNATLRNIIMRPRDERPKQTRYNLDICYLRRYAHLPYPNSSRHTCSCMCMHIVDRDLGHPHSYPHTYPDIILLSSNRGNITFRKRGESSFSIFA